MTWLALVLLAAVVLAPLLLVMLRRSGRRQPGEQTHTRGRREAAMTLHRAQLLELDRDRGYGRIGDAEHATAVLEVQRRLLAVSEQADATAARDRRAPLLVTLALVPLLGVGLYVLSDGHPTMPAAPLAARMAEASRDDVVTDQMIVTLRRQLAGMDQASPLARQGYVLLGNAEDGRGHLAAAADAWRRAVAIEFDPGLAALAAEAQTRVDGGRLGPEARALFTRALATAPADAPWRGLAQQRLAGEAPTAGPPPAP